MSNSAKITINDIFRLYSNQYIKEFYTSNYEKKVIRAITSCRTDAMGGRKEVCDHCGRVVTLYNSCRNRHCPLCQFIKKEKWVMDKQNDILPFKYYHVVFTLPHLLNPIISRNRKKMYKLLFDKVKETLLSVAEDEKYFGAKIGYFAILHTWGQKLNQHNHLHCAVPGGGYSKKKKKWIACPDNYLLPKDVLKPRFRKLFLDALKKMYDNDELILTDCDCQNKRDFKKLIDTLFKTDWAVYLKESFKNNQSVIKYLAKYTHRIAISNHRIIKLENNQVFFKYRDYKDDNKEKIKVINPVDFIRYYMKHVLPHGFVRIRYYGLLSNRNKKKSIIECRSFYEVKIKPCKNISSWQEYLFLIKGLDVTLCTSCNKGRMINIAEIKIKKYRAPPNKLKIDL